MDTKKTSDLIPYEFNNRNHSEQQVDRIANSIKEFGFNQPIVIDESNIVLVGHGRLSAAHKLGLKEVPVLIKKDLSETQKKAYRILDNKLQNDSTWSLDNLELELGFLEDNGFELEPWGLDDLRGLFDQEDPEVEDDEFEESECENEETFIKLGDLIELGAHRVMCGDSTSSEDVDELIPETCDVCFTSPPYNAGDNSLGGNKNRKESKYLESSDDLDQDDYLDFLIQFTEIAIRKSEVLAINIQTLAGNKSVMPQYWYKFRNHIIDRAVWFKGHGMPQQAPHVLNSRFEDILFLSNKENPNKALPLSTFHGTISNVYEAPGNSGNESSKLHAATFPIHLPEWIMKIFSEAKTFFDPFLGSGTTLIAADQLNRICYGMEISPKYCHVIIERYKQHCEKVGKPFECKINGEPFNGASN